MNTKKRIQHHKNKITASAKDLEKDPTPEENPKYGSKTHKNS